MVTTSLTVAPELCVAAVDPSKPRTHPVNDVDVFPVYEISSLSTAKQPVLANNAVEMTATVVAFAVSAPFSVVCALLAAWISSTTVSSDVG